MLLVGVPAFAVAFVRWEHRLRRRDRPPLLDVALLRRTPGYAGGLAVGTLYFTGFTGVLLVLSVWLQDDRGFSPLHAGLLITPFALGSAVSSPLAGRVVTTVGRAADDRRPARRWAPASCRSPCSCPVAPTATCGGRCSRRCCVAGLGGGAVVSPNLTLTLADVPPRWAGRRAAPCRPVSGWGRRSARRCWSRSSSSPACGPRC